MLNLKEFINGLKMTYGAVNVTLTNVDEINVLSIAAPLLSLDTKLVATDGLLSSHKSDVIDESTLKSSINVRKSTWIAVASIGLVNNEESEDVTTDTDVVVNIAISTINNLKYEDISEKEIKSFMRI